MDSVHCPDERTSVSEPIILLDFKKQWMELLSPHENYAKDLCDSDEKVNKRLLSETLNLPSEVVDELSAVCSTINLQIPQDQPCTSSREDSDTTKLLTIRIADQIKKRCIQNKKFRQHLSCTSKYRFFDPLLWSSTLKDIPQKGILSYNEILMVVNVYQPYKKDNLKSHRQVYLKMEQEITVLGSQCLTELRDKITCLTDISVPGDFSENPDMPQDTRAKDLFTSGFFYINGTFYNDMRKLQSLDYSKVIIEWADKNPELEIGPFQKKKMEETFFQDLEIRLGYPYVYQHQGDCEHLIVFKDLRLVTPYDCQDQSQYPLIQSISRRRRVICMICHLMTAKWVTNGNDRLAQDPFFFCDGCFRSFNYTAEGKKIGNFCAYPFFDRSALM